ncbi:bactofilin family protein [Cupriavidus sp. CP313]
MLFSKKKGLSIDTLIGEDTAIDGDLVFAGGLRLDGRVRGNVTAAPGKPSMLVVSEKGMVEGEISVGHLVLNGTVKGPVQATDLLELQPQARVLGDVRYAALEMHQGALVEGRLMPLLQGEIKALPNLVEAAPAAEVTEAADEAAVTDRATPAADAHPTEKAA